MAEFGELLPGTEWRDAWGKRVVVLPNERAVNVRHEDGWTGRYVESDRQSHELWVPWVDPIAVGDTVTLIDQDLYNVEWEWEVMAAFDLHGIRWATLSRARTRPLTIEASECRKVNDE